MPLAGSGDWARLTRYLCHRFRARQNPHSSPPIPTCADDFGGWESIIHSTRARFARIMVVWITLLKRVEAKVAPTEAPLGREIGENCWLVARVLRHRVSASVRERVCENEGELLMERMRPRLCPRVPPTSRLCDFTFSQVFSLMADLTPGSD
jgi:hypothetical protein